MKTRSTYELREICFDPRRLPEKCLFHEFLERYIIAARFNGKKFVDCLVSVKVHSV